MRPNAAEYRSTIVIALLEYKSSSLLWNPIMDRPKRRNAVDAHVGVSNTGGLSHGLILNTRQNLPKLVIHRHSDRMPLRIVATLVCAGQRELTWDLRVKAMCLATLAHEQHAERPKDLGQFPNRQAAITCITLG
ncbi:hypothetical protein IAQ61_007866 [Plenodomus lingam]|uniref:Predicted protein n=1 Tax=Leptosphaeria maculans (strain JN3 / isolate v23.1.3 / race Av1-4-5-6-7-8) TaxID=985895 RepID=E5A4G0_LEPMJ|nr:predicted protein [Plenodomus lingam JN3]KAH9867274.1 hypothetical protein IAQ61_007866 [Plenodomus lingam]CBX98505.1 predicted protein [Plenodomus lingam JN3]